MKWVESILAWLGAAAWLWGGCWAIFRYVTLGDRNRYDIPLIITFLVGQVALVCAAVILLARAAAQ